MSANGIYTLANDVVYDQLVALLNSIERNIGQEMPVCVIPFDDRLDKIKQEIALRTQVSLWENTESIKRWEDFAIAVWDKHPEAKKTSRARAPWGTGHHRKFAAFDGAFEKFIYYDADSLAMKPVEDIFSKLEEYDLIFDDWEHKKPIADTALNIPLIESTKLYTEAHIRPLLHCSSFFASKKGIFNEKELDKLQHLLIEQGEINWVPRWWDDAFLFNYISLRSHRSLYNFTLSPEGKDRTGNCADTDPFVNIDNILVNEQGLKPIHRIHYMNYPAIEFTRLTKGEDVNVRYKDVFLYYRFMKQSQLKPASLKPPNQVTKFTRSLNKFINKLKKSMK